MSACARRGAAPALNAAVALVLGVVVALGMTASGARIVFEDNPSASAPYGQHRHQADQGLVHGPGAAGARSPSYAASASPGGPLPPPAADPEGRLLGLKKKKKKKKVICGLASLIAGRDAAGAAGDGGGREPQHRAARETGPYPAPGPGSAGAQEDPSGRSYGSGLGLAGFVLGTLVGSKLGYGFHQQQLAPGAPAPPLGPTQTQTQVQGVQGLFPVVPVVPVVPAPVHEVPDDYDDVEDDPLGGGGGSLCDQLQNRPEPGPLDSHFPLLSGILSGGQGGGQQQRPLYRPPPRPQHYGYYRPQHQSQQGLLYSYVKPWTDLFFK